MRERGIEVLVFLGSVSLGGILASAVVYWTTHAQWLVGLMQFLFVVVILCAIGAVSLVKDDGK